MTNYKTTPVERLKEYAYSFDWEGDGTAAKTLRLVGSGKKVLELGCSVGTQSKILKEKFNCDITGIELNPVAANQAKEYCANVVVANLDTINFEEQLPDQIFDVALCADVLEHIYDPTTLLKKIKPLLRHDGYLVASIPNVTHIALVFEMLNGRFDYRKTGLLDESHIRFFTRRSIIKALSEAGYIIESLDRGLVDFSDTEFNTTANTPEDRAVIEYIRSHNDECFTYHFIVKALPSDKPLLEVQQKNTEFEINNLIKATLNKERIITELEKQNASLKSQIEWIDNKFIFRLINKIKTIARI